MKNYILLKSTEAAKLVGGQFYQEYGISAKVIRKWSGILERVGVVGLNPKERNASYTQAFIQIVDRLH